jgi:tetratricopeptide (TPR) repeat protein
MSRLRTTPLAAVFTAAALLAGCAPSAGDRVQQNVKTFKSEQKPEKLVAQARAFWSVGDTTRAEEYFAMAIDAGGDENKIIPLLLGVCVQDGRYRVAIGYAENHLRRHPNDVSARFVLGTIYAAVGDAPGAKAELEKVLVARPAEAQAHFALAVLVRDQGDRAAADRHFREYLRLAPQGAYAEEARASLLQAVPAPASPEGTP